MNGRIVTKVFIALAFGATILFSVTSAEAQRGGGRRGGLPPDVAKTVQTLEATEVARSIEANDEQTAKLIEAYLAARAANTGGGRRGGGGGFRGGGGGDFSAFFEAQMTAQREARASFETTAKEFLSDEQAMTVAKVLGSPNNQWDRLVNALNGFGLAEDKLYEGLAFIRAYVITADEGRMEALDAGDFISLQSSAAEAKTTLDEAIAAILSEEQLATWNTSTAPRGRGGFGRGGFGGGGGRRGN